MTEEELEIEIVTEEEEVLDEVEMNPMHMAMNPMHEGDDLTMHPIHTSKTWEAVLKESSHSREDGESLRSWADRLIENFGFGRYQKRLCFLNGALWMADSMEVSLLSFLYQCVGASFHLTSAQAASIVAVVFAGELLGALLAGPLADAYGRRPVSVWAAVLVAVFGLGTAIAPTFEAVVACRFVVGIAIGSLAVPVDLMAEFLPKKHRGTQLTIIEFAWAFGAMYATAASWLTRDYSWRILVVVCSVPFIFVALAMFFLIDESPRWLAEQGRPDAVLKVLHKVAKTNGTALDLDDDEDDDTCSSVRAAAAAVTKPPPTTPVSWRTRLGEMAAPVETLFKRRELRGITALIYIVWMGFGLCFYGISLLATRLFSRGGNDTDFQCRFDYPFIFGITTSEVLGTAALLLLIDRIGRVKSQAIPYFLTAVALVPVGAADDVNKYITFACLYVALGAQMMASAASWVHVAELYPTDVRSTGHSLALTVSRISAFSSSYVVDSTLPTSMVVVILGVVAVFASIASALLPETAGKALVQD